MIDFDGLSHFAVIYLRGSMPELVNPGNHPDAGRWDEHVFRNTFDRAARRFGRDRLQLPKPDLAHLSRLGVTWSVAATHDEFGRIALLLAAVGEMPPAIFQSLLQRCYDQGDTRERQSILRALPLLPNADRFLPIALDACRSHIDSIFGAIACDNPYPSTYYPDRPMNHMVLKALCTGTALNRIMGLERRKSQELTRMAEDYVSERRAAGRSISPDVWLLLNHDGPQ